MLKQEIILKATELGFNLVGFTPFQLLTEETNLLKSWLSNSYQAGMKYMDQNLDKREDVRLIQENCKSVISLGMNYYVDGNVEQLPDSGKVSSYAWGRDYHDVIWGKLETLINFIKEIAPTFEAKSYVDTGPVMDKMWAVKAGLGWQGKHSNVINREIGSWFFISNIFTNYDFHEYENQINNFCGKCTACIDACPTDAIVKDYIVDSNKCISYLTIENKSEIQDKFVGKFDNWIFGCDICQDVCPWNLKFADQTEIIDFLNIKHKNLNFGEIQEFSNRTFKDKFGDSPILRTRAKGLKRNAEFLKKSAETK